MKKAALAMIAISLCVWPLSAQTEEPIVTVKVVLRAEAFEPAQSYPFSLETAVRPSFHINAHIPSEDYLIGTGVEFRRSPGVAFGKIVYPSARMKRFQFSETPLAVYEGTIKVSAEVSLAKDFKGREIAIEGTVGYQACDDKSCLPPAEVEFSRKVVVKGPPKGRANAVLAPVAKEKGPSAVAEQAASGTSPAARGASETVSPFEGKGLLPLFLLVFLGGLALNLTPCVYPLIPITISYFGGQSKGKKGGLVLHAILYVVGMAVTYSVLGSIAAFTGSLFGAALQYPPVLIFIALIMVLLSLSMFDVYELRMPGFLNRIAGGSKKGFLGTLVMGLTVGIVAAPCIGPFVLGLLTYVGNRGSVVLGFSLFFVLALGLGIPFLFLAFFSGSLGKLPRSGAWMVWVRKIFGFVLIVMAIYFLRPLFPTTLLYSLALALTMVIAGLYLAWLEPTRTPGKAFRYVRAIVGIIFFTAALIAASSGIRGYLDEELASGKSGATANAVAWAPYSDDKLAEARATGRPVFIDSFADWCIPCREMDKLTFSRPEVIAASREFIMLKADLTSSRDAGVREFTKKYGIKGVPTLIFLKPDGSEIKELRGTGFEPKAVFLAKMKRALELTKQE